MFTLYLLLILAGLVYGFVIGAMGL